MTRTPVYPVYLKLAVTCDVYTNFTISILYQRCLYHRKQNDRRIGPASDFLRCFLLGFVPYAPLVPCGSGVFCFFRAKSVDRRLTGRIRVMKVGKMRLCTARWSLDAELPNAQPQLPTASCMVGVLNVM